MAKRRTRKQKEKAKHQFTLSWHLEPKKASSKADVKGQFGKGTKLKKLQKSKIENAKFTAKLDSLASIRRDILKSLLLASLILSLEVMIYLAWSR